MANLSGHAAGNGGYRQGDPTVSFDSLLLGRQHHTKPGPRHGPTRLRGEDPDNPLLLGVPQASPHFRGVLSNKRIKRAENLSEKNRNPPIDGEDRHERPERVEYWLTV